MTDWHDLMPSDEELKPLDEIVEKYHAQKLKIRYLSEPRTFLGKIGEFIAPIPDPLPEEFSLAIKEYYRLKIVVKDEKRNYERDHNSEALMGLRISILNFRKTVHHLDTLYHQALGANRVDEGFSNAIDALKNRIDELTKQNAVLVDDLKNCEKDRDGLRKLLGDSSHLGDVTEQ